MFMVLPRKRGKLFYFLELAQLCGRCKEPYLVGGDFNIIWSTLEKNKGETHRHTDLFNSIINSLDLMELHIVGGRFTWSNY